MNLPAQVLRQYPWPIYLNWVSFECVLLLEELRFPLTAIWFFVCEITIQANAIPPARRNVAIVKMTNIQSNFPFHSFIVSLKPSLNFSSEISSSWLRKFPHFNRVSISYLSIQYFKEYYASYFSLWSWCVCQTRSCASVGTTSWCGFSFFNSRNDSYSTINLEIFFLLNFWNILKWIFGEVFRGVRVTMSVPKRFCVGCMLWWAILSIQNHFCDLWIRQKGYWIRLASSAGLQHLFEIFQSEFDVAWSRVGVKGARAQQIVRAKLEVRVQIGKIGTNQRTPRCRHRRDFQRTDWMCWGSQPPSLHVLFWTRTLT